MARRRRFRSKTPDPAVVEATNKLRNTDPTSDTGNSTKMDLTDAETRKRTLVETTGDDDDELAEKYWPAEDFVAKASTDELAGNWLTDEKGIFDNDAAEDTWNAFRQAASLTSRQRPRRLRERWTACCPMELWKT